MKEAVGDKPVEHRDEDLQVGINVGLDINGAHEESMESKVKTVAVRPNQEMSETPHEHSLSL